MLKVWQYQMESGVWSDVKFLTLLLEHLGRNILESTCQFLVKNKHLFLNSSILLPGTYSRLCFLNSWCPGSPWDVYNFQEKCLENTTIKFFRPNYLISRTVRYLIFFHLAMYQGHFSSKYIDLFHCVWTLIIYWWIWTLRKQISKTQLIYSL